MDETSPLRLPYPECDPPLTKDAADIQQVQTLALAVDTEAQRLRVLAGDLIISPDACVIARIALQTPVSAGDPIDFDTVINDNTGGAVPDITGNRLVVRQQGFYYVWASYQADLTGVGRIFVRMNVNGIDTGRSGYGSGTTNVAMTAQRVMLLSPGDSISFIADATDPFTQIEFARAGLWRIV